MAGGAQAKMCTWFSKPNQSLISKKKKKRVGFNLKNFVFALLKTVLNFWLIIVYMKEYELIKGGLHFWDPCC